MHTHPAAGERHRLSLVIMVAAYAAWMMVASVLANLAQTGLIARHHLEAHPNYHLRYPPYTRDPNTAVDAVLPLAGRAGNGRRSPATMQDCERHHPPPQPVQRRRACHLQPDL